MALADLQPFFDNVNAAKNRELEQKRLDQQSTQFEKTHQLASDQLKFNHEHEQAALAAQQAFERATIQSQMAGHPEVIRALGGQPTSLGYSQPMTNGPTNELAAQPPTSENYQVPSQGLGGNQPLNFTIPTIEEAARQHAKTTEIEQAPEFEQQKQIQQMKDEAQNYRDIMNYHRSESKDMRDRDSTERIANAHDIANMAIENARGGYQLKAAGINAANRPELQIHPNVVHQYIDDFQNGKTTVEDYNKDKGLSKEDRYAIEQGLVGSNIGKLTGKQKEALDSLGSLVPYLNNVDSYIDALPHTSNVFSSATIGKAGSLAGEPKRLRDEIGGGFGAFAKALSSVSTGRINLMEATKILNAGTPDSSNYTQQNIAKRNDMVNKVINHARQTLSTLPHDQAEKFIEERLGGYDTSPILNYHDLEARMQGQKSQVDATKLPHINKGDRAAYDKLPVGAQYIDSTGALVTKTSK